MWKSVVRGTEMPRKIFRTTEPYYNIVCAVGTISYIEHDARIARIGKAPGEI